MRVERCETVQVLRITLDEAWGFFSDPRNLPVITPPWLGFTVTSDLPETMYEGMIITYRVRPLARIPLTWVTEITHVDEGRMFVDEQRAGPYRLWHHEHHFRVVPGGVEMRDIVHYALPFGALGEFFALRAVRRRVRGIFAYRRAVLRERFGPSPAPTASQEADGSGRAVRIA